MGVLPKTTVPDALRPLPAVLAECGRLPLWVAGTLVYALGRDRAERGTPAPTAPGDVLLDGRGKHCCLAAISQADGPYAAPEERLHPNQPAGEPAAVYRLCALLCHLLRGEPLWETGLKARRAALRETAAACAPPQQAEELFRLLDRGLRLEPSRRYPSVADLLVAADNLEARMNEAARDTWMIQGAAGFFAGQVLLPQLPAVLGRQPGRCQILFPPETAGVSRLHCRLAYSWGSVLVTDLASRYGTYLDGVRLSPHVPAAWEAGVLLTLGSEKQALRLVEQAKSGEI